MMHGDLLSERNWKKKLEIRKYNKIRVAHIPIGIC